MMLIVSDSSALIALGRIKLLNILEGLYGKIIIPEAVQKEVKNSNEKNAISEKWIISKNVKDKLAVNILGGRLGKGESEVIALGLELESDLLILDEKAARNTAALLGLKFTGTVGILIAAKQKKLIKQVKPYLDSLAQRGFYLSERLYGETIRIAGEK